MTRPVDDLVAEAAQGLPAMKSQTVAAAELTDADRDAAVAYAEAHPDHTAYLVLIALRRRDVAGYRRIPDATKAAILACALAHLTLLNDWGYLDPAGSHDGEAAVALLELGPAAIIKLRPLLGNERSAPLFGSEPATLSSSFGYRRKDFAYRYICMLRGREPAFDADPAVRDAAIERLQADLRAQLALAPASLLASQSGLIMRACGCGKRAAERDDRAGLDG